MNKKELIKKYKSYEGKWGAPGAELARQIFIEDLKLLDEPEFEHKKVKIPQFVADWIEQCKAKRKRLLTALLYTPEKVNSWVDNPDNQKLFARAYLDGYEVEKEKRYIIKLKRVPDGAKFLKYVKVTQEWYFGMRRHYSDMEVSHTRKELEDAGFGWVFDCEGLEVEEVKE